MTLKRAGCGRIAAMGCKCSKASEPERMLQTVEEFETAENERRASMQGGAAQGARVGR